MHWCDGDDDVVENDDPYLANDDGNNDDNSNDDDDGNNDDDDNVDDDGNDDQLHLPACPHIHSGWSDRLPS